MRLPLWLAVAEALTTGSSEHVDEVLTQFTENAGYDVAMARTLLADVLADGQRIARAQAALAAFESYGAERDAARVRQLLRRMGAAVPRAARTTSTLAQELRFRGVTSREAEVLRLIGKGLDNPAIAAELVLSVRTVESHVSSLLAKCGAGNRATLVATAIRCFPPNPVAPEL